MVDIFTKLFLYWYNLNKAFHASSANICCVAEKEPVVLNLIPGYVKWLTISNCWLLYVKTTFLLRRPAFLNIIILVLGLFSLSFQLAQCRDMCLYIMPFATHAQFHKKITALSAYNDVNIFKSHKHVYHRPLLSEVYAPYH